MSSGLVYKRLLKMALPKGQSAFLWGARKTGKSTYLHSHYPKSLYYDLLKSDIYLKFAKAPHLLREEILALNKADLNYPIIIDEVQKVPQLLDEIHWLIENANAQFILCGSSARKLKSQGINMLGGRVWGYTFYPLVYSEISDFDLLRALNTGLVPTHYLSENPRRALKAYVQDYLTQEIKAEGLTRNLPAFARFLDSLVFSNGMLVNYSNIARECAIDAKTVKEYYQILIDTLVGYFVEPYTKKKGRDVISATPKFYLFDVGVASFLAKQTISALKGSEAGNAFEHFILMELMGYRGLNDLDFDINFWRTKTKLEVDFILDGGRIAIEVKIDDNVKKQDLRALVAFCDEHKPEQAYVVSRDARPRKMTTVAGREILILPWEIFLKKLWNKEII